MLAESRTDDADQPLGLMVMQTQWCGAALVSAQPSNNPAPRFDTVRPLVESDDAPVPPIRVDSDFVLIGWWNRRCRCVPR